DAEDQVVAGRGELAQRALAVGAVAGLDVANLDVELALGAEEPLVGAVVERLVAEPADVEHQADPRAPLARRALGSRAERAIGEERDVGRDEGGDAKPCHSSSITPHLDSSGALGYRKALCRRGNP